MQPTKDVTLDDYSEALALAAFPSALVAILLQKLKNNAETQFKYRDLHALLPQVPRSNSFLYQGGGCVIRGYN